MGGRGQVGEVLGGRSWVGGVRWEVLSGEEGGGGVRWEWGGPLGGRKGRAWVGGRRWDVSVGGLWWEVLGGRF